MKRLILTTLSTAALGLTLISSASAVKPLDFLSLTNSRATENEVLLAEAAGQFVTVEQEKATTGTAQIVTENGQNYVVFDEAFDTARGPDVQVVLYTGSEAPVNLAEGDYVTIAALESFEGAQRYLIPADIDVNNYESVAIWCREFNVTFGYAPL
ncbi:MAG: DM13 domain-containing protein [Cyanobacteria bacterium J06559_3]